MRYNNIILILYTENLNPRSKLPQVSLATFLFKNSICMQSKGFIRQKYKGLKLSLLSWARQQVRQNAFTLPSSCQKHPERCLFPKCPKSAKGKCPSPQLKREHLGFSKSTTALITQQRLHFKRVNIKFNGSLMSKRERIFYSESFPSQQLEQLPSEKPLIPTAHHLTQRVHHVAMSRMLCKDESGNI